MKTALMLVALSLVALTSLAFYMGAFRSVTVEESARGPYTLVYRDMAGNDMREVGAITTSLDSLLAAKGIARRLPLDVFYPDRRAEIGFAVEGASSALLASLGAAAKVREIPAGIFMSTSFPFRNPASFMVGYLKVDPAFARHRAAHRYRRVEAMALNEGTHIAYFQPIVRQAP